MGYTLSETACMHPCPHCCIMVLLCSDTNAKGSWDLSKLNRPPACRKLPEAQSVTVRLLLSIDRREEAEAALQTVSFLSEIQHYHLVNCIHACL